MIVANMTKYDNLPDLSESTSPPSLYFGGRHHATPLRSIVSRRAHRRLVSARAKASSSGRPSTRKRARRRIRPSRSSSRSRRRRPRRLRARAPAAVAPPFPRAHAPAARTARASARHAVCEGEFFSSLSCWSSCPSVKQRTVEPPFASWHCATPSTRAQSAPQRAVLSWRNSSTTQRLTTMKKNPNGRRNGSSSVSPKVRYFPHGLVLSTNQSRA